MIRQTPRAYLSFPSAGVIDVHHHVGLKFSTIDSLGISYGHQNSLFKPCLQGDLEELGHDDKNWPRSYANLSLENIKRREEKNLKRITFSSRSVKWTQISWKSYVFRKGLWMIQPRWTRMLRQRCKTGLVFRPVITAHRENEARGSSIQSPWATRVSAKAVWELSETSKKKSMCLSSGEEAWAWSLVLL